jgi:hypothetical protein
MKIYRPVKSVGVNQYFGESKACVKLDTAGDPVRPFIVLTKTSKSCPVGYIDFYTAIGMKGHNGWDSKSYHGEPLYFPVDIDGITWRAITEVDQDGGIGIDVISDQKVMFEGKFERIKFRFWHLKSVAIRDKDPVYLGQLIGYCDSTGASSGDHLHWSMKRVNVDGVTLDPSNGYTGAVDFKPLFEDVFVLDVLTVKNYAKIAILKATEAITAVLKFLKK